MRLKLTLAYDGTGFRGWARQPGERTVEGELRSALGRIFGGYDFASGDRNSTDGVHNTFDVMYPNAHDRFGIADQFGWQNLVSYRGGVTVRLHRRLFVVGQYLDFRLANAQDGIYNVSGGLIARDQSGMSGTHVGKSVETYAWYELNRRISFGAGIPRLPSSEIGARPTAGSTACSVATR